MLLLMSFIISTESFLSLVNASWWPVCGEKPEAKRKPSVPHRPPPDTLIPHTRSQTHTGVLAGYTKPYYNCLQKSI